ncbi:PLP-dependent aminotransferase family protein [Fundicoccus ignavus]|uniref:Aminotransferase class I/II-fold pyridoxal phosphate-dependent enzyme n=1 Tax=Fundicoccus ignavus TaxID=2664442 RepID=A0A844CB34_9LACT|nr:PLP-dependent aminotransferase family protein [Fundicoccus ignavus]MRJ46380.1 aminotransferase class I/II-fold pyridoxal phosphate-dependent enzyme [Fundicoccus ignavus]
MLLNLQNQSEVPLYLQIYKQLKDAIQNGKLTTGQKLMSKRQMAKLNGVSQNTVLNAYDQLLTEGYILAIERSGYFVADVKYLFQSEPTEDSLNITKDCSLPIIQTSYRYNFTESIPDQSLYPFKSFKKIYQDLLNTHTEDLLFQTHPQGLFELRYTLQKYLNNSRGIPCQANQIILGPSSQYLIQLVTQLLPAIKHIGTESPGYLGASQLLKGLGYTIHPIPLDELGLKPEALLTSPAQLLYLTPNHQFPTGNIMPLERRRAILEWAFQSENHYIIEDDYDSEFKYSGIPIPPLKQLDKQNKVIYMGSFSRIISPGTRISYMVLPPNLLTLYRSILSNLTSSLNTLNQWAIYKFMASGQFDSHLNRSRSFYKRKREKLIKSILVNDSNADILGEEAGLYILLIPSKPYHEKQFKQLCQLEGIKITMLSDYMLDQQYPQGKALFLSFSSIPETEIDKAIRLLYQLMQQSFQ